MFDRCKVKVIYPNGRWRMSAGPAHPGPGRDEDPPGSPRVPDWMDDAEWAASLAARESEDEPVDPERCADPGYGPPPGLDDLDDLAAEAREISAAQARAAVNAARLGAAGAL